MTLADRVVVMNKGVVQQAGSPSEIYDRPANVFVAGFIGNPAMNLVEGTLAGSVLRRQYLVKGIAAKDGKITLGFRAEDAEISDGGKPRLSAAAAGVLSAQVYALELLGDATMVTVRAGDAMVAVKAHKEFRAAIGDDIHVVIPRSACHLFEADSGRRVEGG